MTRSTDPSNDTEQRATEAIHPAHADLDTLPTASLLAALIDDQQNAVRAVQAAIPALGAAVEAAAARLAAGGRLVYVGAGTSGRLSLLDATELTPTFSWPPERAVTVMAGGWEAITQAIEGAEDDAEMGHADLRAAGVTAQDVVIGVAASGTTPYTIAAIQAARELGALTVALANNPGTPLLLAAEHPIALDTGPEVISGSTRLKAGTAQKITLNTFSSALMVRLGKVYGNLMVDVRATNLKLQARALRLTVAASGKSEGQARAALDASGGRVKVAVVMLKLGVDVAEAERRLDAAGGHARTALGEA